MQLSHRFACSFVLASVLAIAGITGALAQLASETTPSAGLPSAAPGAAALATARDHMEADIAPLGPDGRRLYIVRMAEPSLAAYEGGIAGLAPTSPRATGSRRLDVNTPASRAYLSFLASRHDQVLAQASQALGRQLSPTFQYLNVLNGVALNLTPDEAAQLENLNGVLSVMPDRIGTLETDVGPTHIGAPAIWDGATLAGLESRGEGVIVGLLDSGINPEHPSFAAVDGDGYQHVNPFGAGNYVGVCDAGEPGQTFEAICNDKLIGAWALHPATTSARDTNNHGSHVASTIAGNKHIAEFSIGDSDFEIEVSGVAPRANIISYLVCSPGCPQTSSVAAINQAIADGVEVLNYSISGVDSPWQDSVDLAFLDAFAAGMYVSASAGNAGPGASTVAKTGPWNAAVGASTHARIFANILNVINGPQNLAAVQGEGPALTAAYEGEVIWAGDINPANVEGCSPFPANSFDGVAALIIRGTCPFVDKVNNAVAAGAEFVIIYNNVGGPPIVMGGIDGTAVSSVMVDNQTGQLIIDLMNDGMFADRFEISVSPSGTNVEVLTAVGQVIDDNFADIMGAFSSRGPSQFNVLAPTFVAPGVNILAAGAQPGAYVQLQGTSMSSPHGAGAAALLRAINPDWTPAEIRSALATSANPSVLLKENAVQPANAFDQGSGLIDLEAAGRVTLVMDETTANFQAANPASGGDPRTLNVPHLVDRDCSGSCDWTRTFTNVSDSTISYDITPIGPLGFAMSATPSNFSLAPGASQAVDFEISFDPSEVTLDTWTFASVLIEPAGGSLTGTGAAPAVQRLPIAFIPRDPVPRIDVNPNAFAETLNQGDSVNRTLNISNLGGVPLNWEIEEAPAAVRLGLTMDDAQSGASPDSIEGGSTYSLILDDGVGENAIGVGGQFIWLNRFTPSSSAFPITIDSVEIMFGYPASSGGVLVGQLVDIYLYEDADGNPANGADHVATLNGQAVQAVDGVTWSVFDLPTPATFNGPGDILIAVVNRTAAVTPGTFPAASDQTPPSQQRSWAGFGVAPADPPVFTDFPNFGIIDSFGAQFAGNWMVRGFGTANIPCDNPADVPWLTLSATAGTTAAAATTPVTVGIDSTGLAAGSYQAVLCISSNDPVSPLVEVPVSLEVEGAARIDITESEISSTQDPDQQTTHDLTINSIGSDDLVWSLEVAGFGGDRAVNPAGLQYGYGARSSASLPTGGSRDVRVDQVKTADHVVAPSNVRGGPISGDWSEGFDDITLLPGAGWAITNNSAPVGTSSWFQGNPAVFPAHQGDPNAYIGVNFASVAGSNTISNWLMTPEMVLQDGTELRFWTRSPASDWEDRLQVRMSTAGASTDVGASATSVGDFTELLLDINPTYAPGGYPTVWTEFVVTVSGVPTPTSGRLALRYFVESGGPSGANSDYIGIDTLSVTQPAGGPPPGPSVLWDNGPFVTGVGTGPGGSDLSVLQNSSLGMTTFGASAVLSGAGPHFRMADNFVVASGWNVEELVFYAYQTGSSTTSTFTGINYRIWDGRPGDPGSNVIFGDTTTNRIADTGWTGSYRVTETALTDTTRPIMYIAADAGFTLAPGEYWVDWQFAGSLASGPWQPPITITGQAVTGDSRQLTATGWTDFIDGGATAGAPQQGLPFQLLGTQVCDSADGVSWVSLDIDSGTTAPGDSDVVTVTLDSTGLAAGDYSAVICAFSNDPIDPLVGVPVNMTVSDTINAFVQVVHLAPFAANANVDIDVNGDTVLTDFAYGDSTGYVPIPAGPTTIEVFPVGTGTAAITANVNLTAGVNYTVIAVGDGDNQALDLVALVDDLDAPSEGTAKLRLGHAAPFAAGSATADVRLKDGTALATNVDFGDFTGYTEVPAGTYDLVITTPGGGTILIDPEPVTLTAGQIATGIAAGDGDNQDLAAFVLPAGAPGFFLPDFGPGLPQDFEGFFPPNGWAVLNNGGDCVWRRNDEDTRPNYAGGDGFSASADSDRCGNGTTMDTELWTPLIDLSDPDIGAASLEFVVSYQHLGTGSLSVLVSDDGGANWDTVQTWTASVSPEGPGTPFSVNLTPYIGSDEVLVSYRYVANGWYWWAQIDQVELVTVDASNAFVQVAHLAPFADTLAGTAVDIFINGVEALSDVPYGASTGYLPIPPGSTEIEIFPVGEVDPAITATVTLVSGQNYTVIAIGDGDNQALELLALEDDLTAPAPGFFHLRLGHLAPFAVGPATADVRLKDGTEVLAGVEFGDVSGFIPLAVGSYDLVITTPGGGTILIDPAVVTPAEGAILSAFATGDGDNQALAVFALPAGAPGAFLDEFVTLAEDFSGASFPPAGWSVFKLEGAGLTTWIRDTAQSFSPPASARRVFGGQFEGDQDDWLVTPSLALSAGDFLTYRDRGQWMGDYGYSGIWISTASCDPADGDFVELLETADIPNLSWRATPVSVDLSAYDGQSACLAFRYSGDWAHTWWIDDVRVGPLP